MNDPRISSLNQAAIQASDHNISVKRIENKLGLYLGQKAMYDPDANSVIDDMAEEAPAFASEKFEKELTKRENAKGRFKSIQNEKAKELAQFYLNLGAQNSATPESLLKLLNRLQQLSNPDAQKFLSEAESEFIDVTDQYIALNFAQEALYNEADPQRSNAANDAKRLLMISSGPAVRAGLNATADFITTAKTGLGEVAQLRDFYRDIILSHEGIALTYQAIEKEYGSGRLPQALSFLIKAAGNDLSALGPSIEPAHLRAIIDNLYQVEVLGGIHDNLTTLLQRLTKNFDITPEIDAEQLMAAILSLSQDFQVDEGNIHQIADNTGAILIDPRIYFLTAFNEQLRLVPLKIYPSIDQRDKILKASQEALDGVIYEEEQEEQHQQEDEDADNNKNFS